MFDHHMGRIGAKGVVLDEIAAFFIQKTAHNPIALAEHTFFLPTRRAVRSFIQSLRRISLTDVLVMPHVLALSDMPPVLDLNQKPLKTATPFERRILMQRLLSEERFKDLIASSTSKSQLFHFIDAVLTIIDELFLYEVAPSDFQKVLPFELSMHQAQTFRLLQGIYTAWPTHLKTFQCLDPLEERVRRYRAYTQHLKVAENPVVTIGIQAHYGFVVDFLKAIQSMPQGYLFFSDPLAQEEPYFKRDVHKGHPAFHLKRLFEKMSLSDVPVIEKHAFKSRHALLTRVFESSPSDKGVIDLDATDGLHSLEMQTMHEEAEVIAVLMAEAVLDQDKTVALVTSHQRLALEVTALLKRWSIIPDNSLRENFTTTAFGRCVTLSVAFLTQNYDPVLLLSLLKHPYVSLGVSRESVLNAARWIENTVMRSDRVIQHVHDLFIKAMPHDVKAILEGLLTLQNAFETLKEHNALRSLEDLMNHLHSFLENLFAGTRLDGFGSVFNTPEGISFNQGIEDLKTSHVKETLVNSSEWPQVCSAFMQELSLSKAWGFHPNAFILGPLEARLLSFDRVILADFNEGRWPRMKRDDFWMSSSMKQALGMDGESVELSQQADDWLYLMMQKEVFITRSKRIDGKPTVNSRWYMRLKTRLESMNQTISSGSVYKKWAKTIWHDAEVSEPFSKPRGNPPVSSRPTRLSLSALKMLKENPYAFYVRSILKLEPLKPLVHSLNHQKFGSLIHQVLADELNMRPPSEQPMPQTLEHMGLRVFKAYRDDPLWPYYWHKRLLQSIDYFLELERRQTPKAHKHYAEMNIIFTKGTPFGSFDFIAKADRVDVFLDGSVRLIDYKTGQCPTLKDIKTLKDMQLSLEGWMVDAGVLSTYDAHKTQSLSYWGLKDGKYVVVDEPTSIIESVQTVLLDLLKHYYDDGAPYEVTLKHFYEDIRHYARWDEWLLSHRHSKFKATNTA